MTADRCSLDWCERDFYALGLCQSHYQDQYRGRPFRRNRTGRVLPPSFKRTTG